MRREPLTLLALAAALQPAATAQDPETTRIHGQVTIVDGSVTRPAKLGSFRLWTYCSDGWTGDEQRTIEFSAGAYEVRLPLCSGLLNIGRAEIEGRLAWSATSHDALPHDGQVNLEFRFLPPATLRLVADENGSALNDCQLIRGSMSSSLDPTEAPSAMTHTAPLELEPWEDDEEFAFHDWRRMRRWWVRAPGYAWKSFEVDHEQGGEHVVRLSPEATLTIRPILPPGTEQVHLSIDGPGELRMGRLISPGAEQQEILLAGLPPGGYRMSTIGMAAGSHRPKEHGRVELLPGQRATFTLDLSPPALADPVDVAGTLSIDPSWSLKRDDVRVRVARVDAVGGWCVDERYIENADLTSIPGTAGELAWSYGKGPAGTYVAFVEPYGTSQVFRREPGDAPVRITIPPRARVRVHLVDQTTGERVKDTSITWDMTPLPPHGGAPGIQTDWDASAGCFAFDAPVGEILVHAWSSEHVPTSETFRIEPGDNELTIRLSPTGTIRVVLQEGTRRVAFPERFLPDAEGVDSGARPVSSGSDGTGTVLLRVAEAGHYKVTLPELPGYRSTEPQLVEVRLGEETTVFFELRRVD